MLNLVVELGQAASFALLAYGAFLCIRQSEAFAALHARKRQPRKSARHAGVAVEQLHIPV